MIYLSPDECPWDPDNLEEKKRKEETKLEYVIDQLEQDQDRFFLRHA